MEKTSESCIDNDYCDKCSEYGGDYYRDENGENICRCLECPMGPCQEETLDE